MASLLTICVFPKTSAGPASSLAMAIAARDAKIPRSIRAPFKNTEIMTARGFGKRSESVRLINCELIKTLKLLISFPVVTELVIILINLIDRSLVRRVRRPSTPA